MQKTRMLAKALNIALQELREISEIASANCFDEVMRQLSPEVRQYITIDMAPVYWEKNEYDAGYAAMLEKARQS